MIEFIIVASLFAFLTWKARGKSGTPGGGTGIKFPALDWKGLTTLTSFALTVGAVIWTGVIAYGKYGNTWTIANTPLRDGYALFKWPFWMLVTTAILVLIPKVLAGKQQGGGHPSYGGHPARGGKFVPVVMGFLGIAALISLLCWAVVGWLHELRATGQTVSSHWVQTAPQAPSPPAVTVNQYGLRRVEFITNFTVNATVPSNPIRVLGHQTILWGPTDVAKHIRVYENGRELNLQSIQQRTIPVVQYTFLLKTNYMGGTNILDIWVATGIL